jgi:hypothetical protein
MLGSNHAPNTIVRRPREGAPGGLLLCHSPSAWERDNGATRLDAARGSADLMRDSYPQRERYQRHAGYGRGDHDPVEVAHGRSVALNALTVEREARSEVPKR